VYHAHVYFELFGIDEVDELRQNLLKHPLFEYVGEIKTFALGPHPCPNMETHFTDENLDAVRDYFNEVRKEIAILIHPVQEDELEAHTDKAEWIGGPITLRLEHLGNE